MSYNPEEVLARALEWMRSRNWHRKLAKSATGQSLIEHTLIELDVFLSLEPVLANPRTFALTESERSIVLAALLCHDLGKESDAWQQYVRGTADGYVPHIDAEQLGRLAPEVCTVLGLEAMGSEIERTVELCARYHHSRPERDDATILEAMLDGKTSFLALAHIVMDIDRLCSAQTAQSAVDHMRRCDLGKHIAAEWHQLSVRGVSSTFLHKAAQQAFAAEGWLPLIFFADATVYYADRAEEHAIPGPNSIRDALQGTLASILTREVSSLIVGNPTGNILPKPDLVSWNESRRYLAQAGRKMNPSSFAKKKPETRRRVVEKYFEAAEISAPLDSDMLELQSQRISHAQPEMVVFKVFKALMDVEKIPGIGNGAAKIAETSYDKIFGKGAWTQLQSTSTLMPAKDMVATVDRYWHLDAGVIGTNGGTTIESLPDGDRMAGLTELLDQIIRSVVQAVGAVSPRDELAANMATAFNRDLLQPAETNSDVRTVAATQAAHYMQSKPMAGKEKSSGIYTCPICNAAFQSGRKASADFIDNPQTHTNRGVSHGPFGYVMVCNACYYERLLRQMLMGTRPAEVITMMPPWNIGPRNGEAIVREVHAMIDAASSDMRGDTGDLSTGFSFGLTGQIAQRMDAAASKPTAGARALALFRYRVSGETNRKRRREIEKRLRENYAEDLEALNAMCGTSYESWQSATEAVSAPGALPADLDEVRHEGLKLYPTMALVCETPNLVFIPLVNAIAGLADESDASKALRLLFAALLLHQVFRTTVAIHSEPLEVDLTSAAGAAWVPPVPAVRSLVGGDWISTDEADAWLDRIGAAARLAQATGYPARSAIYQTIMADPAEMLMHRVGERGAVSITQADLIRKLPFFRTSGLYKEAQS